MTRAHEKTGKAAIIDGKSVAKTLREAVRRHAGILREEHGITPCLAVVIVGDDPASHVYVNSKEKAAEKAGIRGRAHRLPGDTTQEDLLALVRGLNADRDVNGVLVQLPLPGHIDEDAVLAAIDPEKDVDGLTLLNMGRLAAGLPGMVPCTPMGCLVLIKGVVKNLSGLHAVVVGRSRLVGGPVAQLLLRENCTVTIAHSRTKNLAHVVREADILVAAAGRPGLVKGDWIKPGAIVIDVGVNRTEDGLTGDVDFAAAEKAASHITPVPGGVGPMTVACLLANTVIAACRQNGLAVPNIG